MLSKTSIILNCFAKSEKAKRYQEQIKGFAKKAQLFITDTPGSATGLAREAVQNGSKFIVAAGGDGTINEVINGIFDAKVALGILPLGSVNVLARELKIPLNLDKAWKVIEKGKTQKIDLIQVEFCSEFGQKTRNCVQVAGAGLDAHIVQQVTWEMKRMWGPLSYVLQGLKCLKSKLPSFEISIDSKPPEPCAFLLIGNGSLYGGPFSLFPKASLQDGQLDICSFSSGSWKQIGIYLQAIVRGVHTSLDGVAYSQAKQIEIFSDTPIPIQLDGEYIGSSPAKFTVLPNTLNIIVP